MKHANFRGILRCGSVWECPVCALHIRAKRAQELELAVQGWGPSRVYMLSTTVRHAHGHDLRSTRRGLTAAFSAVIRGKPWKCFCAKLGLRHHVRGLEVTFGAHGSHPHIHALLFVDDELTDEQLLAAWSWLQRRWATFVRNELGREFVPNEHGVDLRKAVRADYLAKFGCELTDPGTKRGRRGNRTPFQIATSAASGNSLADEELWIAYCKAMRGAKMLTWSDGFRTFLGFDEKTDQEVVDGEEQASEIVAVIPGAVWDRVRDRRGLTCAILEAAELAAGEPEGFVAIERLIQRRLPRAPRDGP